MNPDGDPLEPLPPEWIPPWESPYPLDPWPAFHHEALEPPKPVKPPEPVNPPEPVEPVDPLEPLEPLELVEPVEPFDLWDGFLPASPSSRPPSVASSYGSIASGVSHPPRAGNKRKKRVDITWSEFDDFSKDGDESKARKRARKEEPDVKRFACPFYKCNPQECKESLTCVGPGWASVKQVK